MSDQSIKTDCRESDIAIVGMAAHLPGAGSIMEFWQNLQNGVESIKHLSEAELLAAGENPQRLRHKNYVPAAAVLEDFEQFDAEFFGFSPKEAAILDPQHRQFLEVAWEALENAGHVPENFDGVIGAFGGCGMGSYFYFNICSNPDIVEDVGMFLLRHTGNDKDFLTTRLSHILDLKGPSISLQTACSTSLVATHYACQSLLNGECDMALAGGVTIELPHGRGYVFQDGEILSPDGHCHAFDHRAQGTVFGSGAGMVVLRRMADAVADGDHIWGVIKGTAVNNDGAAKAGYLAPSVDGQAAAIADALAIAETPADTITYVECHGTGTFLGDPIEIAALTAAFRETTEKSGFCKIGSVKSNIGHLDTAAGVAGLIKTSLALHHEKLPPSLGFEAPNPTIDFDSSPFAVNTSLQSWPAGDTPRRAGVNALGVGGTNAHVVLEEAPKRAESEASEWPFQLITVSGRTKAALDANSSALAAHLRTHPDQPLADIAFTLKTGRRAFEKRRVLVARTHGEAADLLESGDPRRVFDHSPVGKDPEVVFMFPGGGVQYAGMARDLYETEPVFKDWMDRGLEYLHAKNDVDYLSIWLPEDGDEKAAEEKLKRPSVQLPLIMIVEYALAQHWMSWGVTPAVLVGHSMGENTAACLAGVMSFEDCIGLVLLRGQLFDEVPAGGMLSVPVAVEVIKPLLGDELDIAVINAPDLTVVSGPQAALDELATVLAAKDIACTRIQIDIAAHSKMLDPILRRFGDYLRSIDLKPPTIPFLSNHTGKPITASEATDPEYWVRHLRGTIRFADCIDYLSENSSRIYLEVGPGKALSSLAKMHKEIPAQQVLSSLRHADDGVADDVYFMGILGAIWATGVEIDWVQIWGEAKRNRVPLPTYVFQRSPYFIEPGSAMAVDRPADLIKTSDIEHWGYQPAWRPVLAKFDLSAPEDIEHAKEQSWLIFLDEIGVGKQVVARLRSAGHPVVEVTAGDSFYKKSPDSYVVAPEHGRAGFDRLIQDLVANGRTPTRIINLWLLTGSEKSRPGSSFFHQNQERGFYALLFLAQAIADENLSQPLHFTAVTTGAMQVRHEVLRYPEKATLLGPLKVVPHEFPGVTCAMLDVELSDTKTRNRRWATSHTNDSDILVTRILEEVLSPPENKISAWRGAKRFEQFFRPLPLSPVENANHPTFRENGTYMITGGFGGVGLTLAKQMIVNAQARVVLLSRTPLPDRVNWENHLHKSAPNDPVAARISAVQELESLGGQVLVVVADVCNIEDMHKAVTLAEQRFGRLNGVIHAAGVIDDAPMQTKSVADIEAVFTPKIHGTQVLHEVFADGDLDWLVLCASTSTVTGPMGQVDYVAANAYLNAYAKSRAQDRTKVVAINWGIWNEVGMAADAVAQRIGGSEPLPLEPIHQALLDSAGFDSAGNRIFSARYKTSERWVLDEHRVKSGASILPGTGYLELAAEALRAQGEDSAFEIRDLLFLRPLHVEDDSFRDVQVRLVRSSVGYDFDVRGDCTLENRPGMSLNATASLALIPMKAPPPLDIQAIDARCKINRTANNRIGLRSPQEAHLKFGKRWRVLRDIAFGKDEAIARLKLPKAARTDIRDGYLQHPALLDLATGWALELIEGYQPTHLWVPLSYQSVRVHKSLPDEIYSWVRTAGTNRAENSVASFDIVICDKQGEVCLNIEGFVIKRLESNDGLEISSPLNASEVEFSDAKAGGHHPLSRSEERLHYNLTQGILPDEGAEAFARAMQVNLPQVIVSSLELDGLVAQAAQGHADPNPTGQKFQRPELDTDFEVPTNDIERMLAGFWQELLGVEQIGIQDNFFDLGGHSLIAVRLFAMVRNAYRIDFPISILFEAPTIAKCAALIAAKTGYIGDDLGHGKVSDPKPNVEPTQRFTHLVPMHDGEGGSKTPMFLVAGMFGNVLNLRHLAHLLGTDRPFFGLQARGLFGDQSPHLTIHEAAQDYIAEMQQVQPNGPYILGGFSGGGIVAYEIAQQLKSMGEAVVVLAMLDAPLPVRKPLSKRDRLVIQLAEIKQKGVRYFGEWAIGRLRWELSKLKSSDVDTESTQPTEFNNQQIEAAFLNAVATYKVEAWDGNLALFRPPLVGKWQVSGGGLVSSQRAYVTSDNDWTQWVPDMQVVEVPGDHDSMVLEPNVRVLAARLRKVIDEAEQSIRLSQDNTTNWSTIRAAE